MCNDRCRQTRFGPPMYRRQSRVAGAEGRQPHYLPDTGAAHLLHHPGRHGLSVAQVHSPGIDALGPGIRRQTTPGHGAHRNTILRQHTCHNTAHGARGAGHQNGFRLAHGVGCKAPRGPPDARRRCRVSWGSRV